MKIVLAHAYFLNEDEVEQRVMKPYPPLGLLYVSGYLTHKNVQHQVYDTTFSSMELFKQYLFQERPAILGLYVNFLTRKNVLSIINLIKKSKELADMVIILGGPDVRYNSHKYLDRGADYIVKGEGEQTFFDLVSSLTKNSQIDDLKGISYKGENSQYFDTGERPHISDLAELILPNREKIDLLQYLKVWKTHHGYSSISINTQRGCSFTCTWCSHSVFGDTYRRRPVDFVVNEIEKLINQYHPDSFWFVDDVFTMSEKWLMNFTSQLNTRKIQISYECISRADRLNKNIIQSLSQSGCKMLWIGAESGSQKVLDLMDRKVKASRVRDMIKLAKAYGIRTGTFIMLGYPGETMSDINETIRHLIHCDPDIFTINKAYPIRGTKFYELVKDKIMPEYNWDTIPDRDINFSKAYSDQFYKMAIRKVYNEVYAEKQKRNRNWISFFKFRLKASMANFAIQFIK